jgi:TRAP transporter 4TM/12TM fusion protein
LTIEAARRVVGLGFALLTVTVLFYARFGEMFPSVLFHKDYDLERIITGLFMTTEGVYGLLTGISATFIFVFVLFGAMLRASGAGDFFIQFASSLFGHVRGGPAKIAVVASSLFAMVSSSGLANAAASGQLTIPLMKEAGYKRHFAAAVEAVSSEAGVLMPPVMGGTVFIMMEILGVSYVTIMQSVVLVAVLYYVALFLLIDIEAAKTGLRGVAKDKLPPLWPTLVGGAHFFIPPLIMVYMLVIEHSSPMRAALWAILAIPVVTWLRPARGMRLHQVLDGLESGAIQALTLIGVLACANIMVGIIDLTGVGLMASTALTALAGDSRALLLLLTAIATIILGMGLPAIAAYVVLVVTVAPALTNAGVEPLAAHLFIFYYAMISQITPPIAPTAFVTANIAGAPFLRTAFTSCRLAIVILVLPWLLVYNPILMMRGGMLAIMLNSVTALAGVYLLAGSVQGYYFGRVGLVQRALLLVGAGCFLVPGWQTDLVGLILLIGLTVVARPPFLTRVFASRNGGA